jgi:hypothetical protein
MPGGLLSGVLFQYPGAIIMAAVGVLAAEYLAKPKGWLLGLTAGGAWRGRNLGAGPRSVRPSQTTLPARPGVSAVGVAMVASAAKAMAGKLCAGWLRASICTVAVVVAYYWPQARGARARAMKPLVCAVAFHAPLARACACVRAGRGSGRRSNPPARPPQPTPAPPPVSHPLRPTRSPPSSWPGGW